MKKRKDNNFNRYESINYYKSVTDFCFYLFIPWLIGMKREHKRHFVCSNYENKQKCSGLFTCEGETIILFIWVCRKKSFAKYDV